MSRVCALCLIVGFLSGCSTSEEPLIRSASRTQQTDDETTIQSTFPRALSAQHLSNLVQLHANVISGGLPEGKLAFCELNRLGIKTIISVDSARPDLVLAHEYGLKYIHLPHGYDGISRERILQLSKAVRDLDGPIYIHCHHGKHRGPTAASVACVGANLLPASQAVAVLTLAGTSPDYSGLFAAAASAVPINPTVLNELIVDFSETTAVPPMAEAMVAMDRTHERVLQVAAAGWKSPPDHPDVIPEHEALILLEHYSELWRIDDKRTKIPEFVRILKEAESKAGELKDGLSRVTGREVDNESRYNLDRLSLGISLDCNNCHHRFRDSPRNE